MRKYMWANALVASAAIAIAGCGGDDLNNGGPHHVAGHIRTQRQGGRELLIRYRRRPGQRRYYFTDRNNAIAGSDRHTVESLLSSSSGEAGRSRSLASVPDRIRRPVQTAQLRSAISSVRVT